MLDAYLARMGLANAEPTEQAAAAVTAWFARHFAEGGVITVEERLGMSEFTRGCVRAAAALMGSPAPAPTGDGEQLVMASLSAAIEGVR